MTGDTDLKAELERMRLRLLDLSARNPLLNYAHPRASSLRIVDEVPALVLESLVVDGGFRFAPLKSAELLPLEKTKSRRFFGKGSRAAIDAVEADEIGDVDDDPSAQSQSDDARREAAKAARALTEARIQAIALELGINPSYDLLAVGDSDADQHGDDKLQTLITPDALEARLQKMQATAVTAIQESGANMLHLLFGFVEWTDEIGGKARMAPLVLVPATLSRLDLDTTTYTFPYTVAASGEDWSTNVTFQEKCRRDFGFVLPSIEPEENLEDYFARIERVLQSAPKGWRVRRQLTLGLVSFGKILMWRDLDPATWPEGRSLLRVPLLREVLGADDPSGDEDATDGSAETRTTEYNIDNLPSEFGSVPPIVVPADSSQHSVLVDVQRGDNLVVQGPPGTGKSQTITNIIAGAIAARKKILFIAEKKAALEVVARRLTDVGLGPFCLPLHSHTSNKREFLDGLKERIDIGSLGNSDGEMAIVEELLRENRQELTAHAKRLHAPFGSLGDTAFSIFWRTRRLSAELPEAAITVLRDATLVDAIRVTPAEVARHRATLRELASAHGETEADVRQGEVHPWYGVRRVDLSFDASEALIALAKETKNAWSDVEQQRLSLIELTDGTAWPDSTVSVPPVLAAVANLEPPAPPIPSALISAIHGRAGEDCVREAIEASDAARRAWSAVEGPWGAPGSVALEQVEQCEQSIDDAVRAFGDTLTVRELNIVERTMFAAADQLSALKTLTVRLAAELSVDTPLSVEAALALVDVVSAAERLPEGALTLRSPALEMPSVIERATELSNRAKKVADVKRALDERFPVESRPSFPELREMGADLSDAPRFLPSLFSGAYRRSTKRYRRMSGGRTANRAQMTGDIQAVTRHLSSLDELLNEPMLLTLFGAASGGIRSPFAELIALLEWTRACTIAFRTAGAAGHQLMLAVWSSTASAWSQAGAELLTKKIALEKVQQLRAGLQDVGAMTGENVVVNEPTSFATVAQQLERWHTIALNAKGAVESARLNDDAAVASLSAIAKSLRTAWAADDSLGAHEKTFRDLGMQVPESVTTNPTDVLSSVRQALGYLSQFSRSPIPPKVVDWLATEEPASRLVAIQHAAAELSKRIERADDAEQRFATAGAVDLAAWYGIQPGDAANTTRIDRLDRALDASGALSRLTTYLRVRATVGAGPLPKAIHLLEKRIVLREQIPDCYDYVLARTLSELVLRERPELDHFSGKLHETRRAEFSKLDEGFIEMTRRIIGQSSARTPRVHGNGYGLVKDLTEQNLIEHEIAKTRRHIPIREMFKRAGRAIQSLKPCIMMGPQAVAQYLPPGLFHFDLIVMDEASQMRPEDALGAIARGSQLVVVGDPKQLGPSAFFDTQSSDDDEIDENAAALAAEAAAAEVPRGASVLERSESILQAAARRYPMRMLRWHYRSKYPELIAFSNQEFYGGDLVLFPHPGTERECDGVNFHSVDNALYGSGTNLKEAEAVVSAVRKHAAESPERTLLVVTMNQRQRELVDTLIQRAEKEDPALSFFRARHHDTLEPFGVKNLENVQGDERDVIYVSVTYGPNERGTVSQGFGPINMVGGERRLNVLFTRAKFRLDVFCSFEPSLLKVTPASPRGLCVFRDYLIFAKEKSLATGRFTAREPDSDFEVEVARAIRQHGYDVHPQVGVAGYFLDLAVVDPNRPGRYVLGVECDGATYHSAKSARDRDRLRQEVLEGLGWNIHRIWSTDWFRDPRGETLKAVRHVEQLTIHTS